MKSILHMYALAFSIAAGIVSGVGCVDIIREARKAEAAAAESEAEPMRIYVVPRWAEPQIAPTTEAVI